MASPETLDSFAEASRQRGQAIRQALDVIDSYFALSPENQQSAISPEQDPLFLQNLWLARTVMNKFDNPGMYDDFYTRDN